MFNNHPQEISPIVSGVVDVSDPNHPVEVYYGRSDFDNLAAMLNDLGIRTYKEDKVEVFPAPEFKLGSKITIKRALPVEVTDAKVVNIYRTWQKTVGELLRENEIDLLGQDTVEPDQTTWLREGVKIKITRVAEVEVVEKEPINYSVIKRTSVDVEKGQTAIDTKGINGEKEVTYVIKRVDGVEVSKTKKSETVTRKPTNEILIIGIGPKLARSGPYKDTINDAAKKYLINGTALMCLMLRESGGNANSVYDDGENRFSGLFQYSDGFWSDISARAGFGGASIYNASAQIYTTAYALTHGYSGRWPPWGGCTNR